MAARPAARRHTRQRVTARSPVPPSATIALRDNLAAIDVHVTAVQKPVRAVQDLIGEVKAPLAFPRSLHQDLTDLHRLLASLRVTVTPLSLLPGPIGPASRALKQTLEALAGPPQSGSIGRARDLVGRIGTEIEPLRRLVERIETPVADAVAAVDAIESNVAYLRDMVASVIAYYGSQPPKDVEACAARLNTPVAAVRAVLDETAARVAGFFAMIEKTLRSALAVLKPIGDVVRAGQSLLSVFRGKAMKAILGVLTRFSNGIKPYVNKVEIVVRVAINRLLRKIGLSMDTFTGYIRKVINALNPMKPIERAVNAALASVRKFIAQLIDVSAIDELLEILSDLERQLTRAVEAFLRSRCKAVLDPAPGRFARGHGPRRTRRIHSQKTRSPAIRQSRLLARPA
ncbi:MAG: hypothetical protein NFCOHLIN_01924 [Gammaproteobacteria bacterium]|nr:hypothetical protein [Gammaproteobacteria bacterium]